MEKFSFSKITTFYQFEVLTLSIWIHSMNSLKVAYSPELFPDPVPVSVPLPLPFPFPSLPLPLPLLPFPLPNKAKIVIYSKNEIQSSQKREMWFPAVSFCALIKRDKICVK